MIAQLGPGSRLLVLQAYGSLLNWLEGGGGGGGAFGCGVARSGLCGLDSSQ